jgi:hypothetical protein
MHIVKKYVILFNYKGSFVMNKEEIRFHILYYLYNKHSSGEVGKYQSADNIVEESELKSIDRNAIDEEFAHLNNGGYLKGQRDTSDGGIPYSVVITKSGIEIVESVTQQIITNINEEHTSDEIQNEIMPINNETNQNTKTSKIWEYVKSKPGLFNSIGEIILRKALGG